MDTLAAIRERRAVKHFDPQYRISSEDLKKLYDHVRLCPTSFNIQHWRIVRVVDRDLRAQIRAAAWNQPQVTEASELFVICADVAAWAKHAERYWSEAPVEVQKALVPMIAPFYEGNKELQRDEAMRSVGLVAQTLMLAAKSLGLDSCPMIGFDQQKVSGLIRLPDDHLIGMIVVVGKALKPANPRGGFIPENEAFLENSF